VVGKLLNIAKYGLSYMPLSTMEWALIGLGILLLIWILKSSSKESLPEDWSYDLLYNEFNYYEFEEVVAELWSDKGYNIKHSDEGPDGGVDVKATKRGTSITIEVKQYNKESNSVGDPIVKKVMGASQNEGTRRCMVVTTSRFTRQAKETEDNNSHVKLVCGDDLVGELQESTLDPADFEEKIRS
jgi:predicted helicase